jgi:hypothetical protein
LLATTLVVGLAIVGRLNQWRLVDVAPPHPPSVLVARAHEIIQSLGYPHPPADSAYWFTHKASYLEQVLDRTAPFFAKERDPLRPFPALRFVYRESPAQLVPANIFGLVLYRDPPRRKFPACWTINLDGHGRLLRFCAIPDRRTSTPESFPSTPDWAPLLTQAGLRPDALSSVTPAGIPRVAYDALVEWKVLENASDLRVTAAAFDGIPVYFDVDSPARSAARPAGERLSISRLTADPTVVFVSAALTLVCAVVDGTIPRAARTN